MMGARAHVASKSAAGETIQDIVNTALIAEQLAMTFYYTGLTTQAIARTPQVAGSSGNPLAVAPDGNPGNVAYLQAALDQEYKHAVLLKGAGAVSPFKSFYFPAPTFESLGFTSHAGTYLWVLDHLETAFIGAYMAAVKRFALLERPDLALVALRILGVECQHRALYRVISGDDPADNVTLEVAEFDCVADAVTVLTPFLTGHGLRGGATAPIALPTAAQTASVIGSNRSV
jgi:hypothetical protein